MCVGKDVCMKISTVCALAKTYDYVKKTKTKQNACISKYASLYKPVDQ